MKTTVKKVNASNKFNSYYVATVFSKYGTVKYCETYELKKNAVAAMKSWIKVNADFIECTPADFSCKALPKIHESGATVLMPW